MTALELILDAADEYNRDGWIDQARKAKLTARLPALTWQQITAATRRVAGILAAGNSYTTFCKAYDEAQDVIERGRS